jgi:hypothetical protein
MSDLLNRRAVVVGAGIGDLSAAGVLAPHFGQVDILERDNIPNRQIAIRHSSGSALTRPSGWRPGALRDLSGG